MIRRARATELGSAWIGVAAGIALTILRTARGETYDRTLLPMLAFGTGIALPGLLALMASRRRPSLYLASGLVYMPLSFLSMGGVTLPLMFLAAMAFVAYGRHADEEKPVVWAPLTAVVMFLLTIASFAAMHYGGGDDPRCSSTGNSTSCTSDVITNGEAFLGLAGVALSLAAAWFLSVPRSSDRTDPTVLA